MKRITKWLLWFSGRPCIFFMWGVYQILLVMLSIAMIQEHVLAEGWGLLLFMSALMSFLTYAVLYNTPFVELTPEGIHSRVMFKKSFCSWEQIKQVGILQVYYKYGKFPSIVAVKPNGSKRKYKDKTFRLRNYRKLIHIGATEENIELVRKYYGPLDFDLSNRRNEESTLADEIVFEES